MVIVPLFFSHLRSPARVRSNIANGGPAPIRMTTFPPVKPTKPDGVTDEPNTSGPKVHVLVAHHAYKFDAIPDVRFRHADRHHNLRRRRGHVDPCGRE